MGARSRYLGRAVGEESEGEQSIIIYTEDSLVKIMNFYARLNTF